MQLEQSFLLPMPPARAWPAFRNVDLLVDCLPGASLTGPAADGKLPLRMDVKLGPIAAAFAGEGSVDFDDAQRSGSFEGQAADKRTGSRVRGKAVFSLQAHEAGTRVQLGIDYTLTGALAQFSRGAIVRELASALTAQFAGRLAERLRDAPEPAAGAVAAADVAPAAAGAADASAGAPPLDLLSFLGQLLRARWQRLWARWRPGDRSA